MFGYVNRGYMDFYDIYLLNRKLDFDGEELEKSIQLIFEHRKTTVDDIIVFESDFAEDSTRVLHWNSFVKKKRATLWSK